MEVGGDVPARPRQDELARRVKRRVPIAVCLTALVIFGPAMLPGARWTARDAAAATVWAIGIGAAIGVAVSVPAPQGRWWRWAAPTLATIASVPLVLVAEVVLWAAAVGDVNLFGGPNEPASWYTPAAAVLAVTWLGAVILGYVLADERRRWALAPLVVTVASLGVMAVLVSVT